MCCLVVLHNYDSWGGHSASTIRVVGTCCGVLRDGSGRCDVAFAAREAHEEGKEMSQSSGSVSLAKQSIDWKSVIPFLLIHILCFGAIWTGVHVRDVVICLVLYVVRMFAITGGFHRYFSHRTYKMGRVMQFLMAFVAQTSSQRGALWWAGCHRHHHKHSDQPGDLHSPVQSGFWMSHVMWIFVPANWDTDPKLEREFRNYPELLWLNRWTYLPPTLLGLAVYWYAGWSGLVVGFFWSTVLLWHGTFTINSLSHVFGRRRYDTTDDSRNNWFLALITLGEGWHNNHHYYQSSTRQGFFWWEVDVTYMILKMMSWVGLVWDLREPPRHIVENRPKYEVMVSKHPDIEGVPVHANQ
jgi:stearoyl-CoA desaturase (delta-9 desaturase)